MEAFQWGANGRKITTPAQAARQRAIAEALMMQGTTPAANIGQGLADVTAALSGSVLNNEALAAEEAGGLEASGLFSGLSSSSPQADIIAALNNPWANENQSGVARALLGDQLNVATAPDAPSSVREWEYFNTLTPEQQAQYITMKRANPYLDVGTGYVAPDPLNPGAVAGPEIVKDNFTPAYDKALGGAQGATTAEVQASFDSLNSKLPGIRQVVDELSQLSEQATYTMTGKLWDDIARETGAMPSEGALARAKYIAMVDNQVLPLLRDTFGAAFTVKEGETLRATLGDPTKSPPEKKAVLEAFIEQKTRDLQALASRLPGAEEGVAAPVTRLKFNPATGDLE